MTLFDLVFLGTVLLTFAALVALAYAAARRRFARVRRILALLFLSLGGYAIILIVVSLVSPQRVIPPHQKQCFDEWCFAVAGIEHTATIGTAPTAAATSGTFSVVTVEVSNQGKRQRQRETDASIWLIDDDGHRYAPSPDAQRALDALGRSGSPLDTFLAPGEVFTHTVAFDVPSTTRIAGITIAHSRFPVVLIIGDGQSFLHKPTLLRFPE